MHKNIKNLVRFSSPQTQRIQRLFRLSRGCIKTSYSWQTFKSAIHTSPMLLTPNRLCGRILKSTASEKCWRNYSWQFNLLSECSAEICWPVVLIAALRSNKPTHSLLDYGNFNSWKKTEFNFLHLFDPIRCHNTTIRILPTKGPESWIKAFKTRHFHHFLHASSIFIGVVFMADLLYDLLQSLHWTF